jgi:hypothetical protein
MFLCEIDEKFLASYRRGWIHHLPLLFQPVDGGNSNDRERGGKEAWRGPLKTFLRRRIF